MATLLEPRTVSYRVGLADSDPYLHVSTGAWIDWVLSALFETVAPEPPRGTAAGDRVMLTHLSIDFMGSIELKPGVPTGEVKVTLKAPPGSDGRMVQFEVHHDRETPLVSGTLTFGTLASAKIPLAEPAISASGKPIPYELHSRVAFRARQGRYMSPATMVDTMITSRWYALIGLFPGVTPDSLARGGLAFFVRNIEMDFNLPVDSMQSLLVRSWISDLENDGKRVLSPFEIRSADGGELFTRGVVKYAVVDPTARPPRSIPLPDYAFPYFFLGEGRGDDERR